MIKEKNKMNFPAYLREPGKQKVSRAFIPQKKKNKSFSKQRFGPETRAYTYLKYELY